MCEAFCRRDDEVKKNLRRGDTSGCVVGHVCRWWGVVHFSASLDVWDDCWLQFLGNDNVHRRVCVIGWGSFRFVLVVVGEGLVDCHFLVKGKCLLAVKALLQSAIDSRQKI
jgi:hypothetical protein